VWDSPSLVTAHTGILSVRRYNLLYSSTISWYLYQCNWFALHLSLLKRIIYIIYTYIYIYILILYF